MAVLPGGDGSVAGGLARGQAGRDALDPGVVVGLDEEGERLAPGAALEPGRRVDHPVQVGEPAVVGPDHHQIADIDHEGTGGRAHIDPRPVPRQRLEPARRVVDLQQRVGAEIRMRAAAELPRRRRPILVGVVDRPQHAGVAVEPVEEILRLDAERGGEDAEQAPVQPLQRAVILPHRAGQPRHAFGPDIGLIGVARLRAPVIGIVRQVDAAEGERLAVIRRRGGIVRRGDELVAERHIAPVDVARGVGAAPLGRLGQVEEGFEAVGDPPHRPGIDAVPRDREEADLLDRVGHRAGDPPPRGLAPGLEAGDVDQRDFGYHHRAVLSPPQTSLHSARPATDGVSPIPRPADLA